MTSLRTQQAKSSPPRAHASSLEEPAKGNVVDYLYTLQPAQEIPPSLAEMPKLQAENFCPPHFYCWLRQAEGRYYFTSSQDLACQAPGAWSNPPWHRPR